MKSVQFRCIALLMPGLLTLVGCVSPSPLNRDALTLTALRWVQDHPDIRNFAVRAVNVPEMDLQDAFMEDPMRILIAAEAIVDGAKQKDAPSDVITALERISSKMRAGAQDLHRFEYTMRSIASIQGIRDSIEQEKILERAMADAPDDDNRSKLKKILNSMRKPLPFNKLTIGNIGDLTASFDCDWGCCLFVCIMCTVGCPVCCAAACLLC